LGVPTKEHDISWRSRATEQPSAATNPQRSTKMAQVPTKDYQPEDDTPHILECCPLAQEQRITGGADAKETNIVNMFLNGLVDQSNKGFWNAELASARAAREKLEAEMKKS